MASWNEILVEIQACPHKNAVDEVRRSYIKKLSEYTNRNVIIYYSAWLTKSAEQTDIVDYDMNGFMTAVKNLDCSKGLDLILHTPGGVPTAAEAIVKYLRTKFNNDIRAIVPQLAMSAGTMIACSAQKIIMGKQSSLGPIDPQFNGIPAYNIVSEFSEAKQDLLQNKSNFDYWRLLLGKYPAAFVKLADDAIALSDTLLREWLKTGMFKNEVNDDKLNRVCQSLNEHQSSKVHARHFDIGFCQRIGLDIIPLESDQKLQDRVLSVHHSCIHTFAATNALKIIENQEGKAFITLGK